MTLSETKDVHSSQSVPLRSSLYHGTGAALQPGLASQKAHHPTWMALCEGLSMLLSTSQHDSSHAPLKRRAQSRCSSRRTSKGSRPPRLPVSICLAGDVYLFVQPPFRTYYTTKLLKYPAFFLTAGNLPLSSGVRPRIQPAGLLSITKLSCFNFSKS